MGSVDGENNLIDDQILYVIYLKLKAFFKETFVQEERLLYFLAQKKGSIVDRLIHHISVYVSNTGILNIEGTCASSASLTTTPPHSE